MHYGFNSLKKLRFLLTRGVYAERSNVPPWVRVPDALTRGVRSSTSLSESLSDRFVCTSSAANTFRLQTGHTRRLRVNHGSTHWQWYAVTLKFLQLFYVLKLYITKGIKTTFETTLWAACRLAYAIDTIKLSCLLHCQLQTYHKLHCHGKENTFTVNSW